MAEISVSNSRPVNRVFVAAAAAITAFLAYSAVYSLRKPFTVATFEGLTFAGVSYQTMLIISQVTGYMLSKFAGIKLIAELKSFGRFSTALILVSIAWISLFVFAIVPPVFGLACLFINGFTLGFLWGIIFSYLEGRRATDVIGAVMAISFIFAGGFTRSVAKWLMLNYGVTETWMPFMTGMLFMLPLVILLKLLDKIPPPDASDINERSIRLPMNGEQRKHLLRKFGTGIVVISASYFFLTIMRDIRDNYMSNIWAELGYGNNYTILTSTETTTSLLVLIAVGLLVLIRKNHVAFSIIHIVVILGFIIALISSWLFITERIGGAMWMQLISLGLYLGYIPFNCIFFERMIASFRIVGNAGFLIYLADSFGYLGSVVVMLVKEFMPMSISWSGFYSQGVIYGSIAGIAGTLFSLFYFNRKFRSSTINK